MTAPVPTPPPVLQLARALALDATTPVREVYAEQVWPNRAARELCSGRGVIATVFEELCPGVLC